MLVAVIAQLALVPAIAYAELPARAERIDRVAETILPEVTRAWSLGTLTAVTQLIEQVTSGAVVDGTHVVADEMTNALESLALWGSADYRSLDSGAAPLTWEGNLTNVYTGVDVQPVGDLWSGLSVSWSHGAFAYADNTSPGDANGTYASQLLGLHHYLMWARPGFGLWVTGGVGWGEIEIDDDGDPEGGVPSSALTQLSLAGGATGTLVALDDLIAGGVTSLTANLEAAGARSNAEGNDDFNRLSANATTMRLSLKARHDQSLGLANRFTASVEVGVRQDVGDGLNESGWEVGGGLRLHHVPWDLTVEGHGHALVKYGDEEGFREWGIGGLVRLAPGGNERGLAISVQPAWGDAALAASTDRAAGQVNAEVAYGFAVLADAAVLAPFAGLTLAPEGTNTYRIGGRLRMTDALNLSLTGEHHEDPSSDSDQALILSGELHW